MKVAILIPTINRPSFIERTVKYYDSLESQHPLYIGDASSSEISQKTASFLKSIKNVEVKYFHWKGLNSIKTMAKLAEKASVECEYCSVHGDDDYLIPSSVTKCSLFLSKNFEYRTAQGHAGLVVMDSAKPIGNIKWMDVYWGKNFLEESSKLGRLSSFNKSFYSLQFSVHRIGEFITDSKDFTSITNVDKAAELLHSFTMAINGKSKFIDCLYMIRVRHLGLFVHSSNVLKYITDDSWKNDYNITVNSLSRILSEDNKISYKEAKKIINNIMKDKDSLKQFTGHKKKIESESIKNKTNTLIKIIKFMLVKFGLKFIVEPFRKKNNMQLWTAKGARFYYDFLPIKNSLTGKSLLDN